MRKQHHVSIPILAIAIIILLSGGLFLYNFNMRHTTATLQAIEQTESTDYLDRPECGWYQLYAYRLEPDTLLSPEQLYINETDGNGISYRVALLEINLVEYADKALDAAAQENIQKIFDLFADSPIKIILRFLYDWDGSGEEHEPKNMLMIREHMREVGNLINKNTHVIYTIQGIFVGSWGEMHGSAWLSAEDMTTLLLQYAYETDESVYLAVRTPDHYRTIMEELTNHPERYQNFNITPESLKKRLGLYNDGLLGSISDLGTYKSAAAASTEEEGKLRRKEELMFQNELCLSVPNGGEAVTDNPYNDWENAIADLRTMHVSYLNQMYDKEVIDKWKNSSYQGEDTLYHGMSAYDYITRHLGARFVLRDCTLSQSSKKPYVANGTLTIENTGFSNLYHPKKFNLDLIHKETGSTTTLLSQDTEESCQPTHWNAGEVTTLNFHFSPEEYAIGEYTLIAKLYDEQKEETLPFANNSFSEEYQGYELGTITLTR